MDAIELTRAVAIRSSFLPTAVGKGFVVHDVEPEDLEEHPVGLEVVGPTGPPLRAVALFRHEDLVEELLRWMLGPEHWDCPLRPR